MRLLNTIICATGILTCGVAQANDAPDGDAAMSSEGVSDHNSNESDAPELTDDNLVIVELRFGRYILSDGFLGHEVDGELYVPLSEFAAALEFAITSQPDDGLAEGWFLEEGRRFSLSIGDATVSSDGARDTLSPADAIAGFDDIYVRLALVSEWFPVDADYIPNALLITVESREPLPLERMLARQQQSDRLDARAGVQSRTPQFERRDQPYRPISTPFVDLNAQVSYAQQDDPIGSGFTGGDDSIANAAPDEITSSHSLYLTSDLAFMTGEVSLIGNENDAFTDARLTLSRADPDGRLLGPVGATSIEMGDISSPELPLSARSVRGRGVTISNFPLDRVSEFDRVTIRGELPAGWDAQLYRNDTLLAAQDGDDSGLYEFTDIQLLSGENIIRVELFGPQGQRRTDTRRFTIGENLLRRGDVRFRASASQSDTDMLEVRDTSNLEGAGELRASSEVELGLTRGLSVAGAATTRSVNDQEDYVLNLNVGVRAALLGAYSRIDVSSSDGGGKAGEVATQFTAFGNNLFVQHTELDDYVSEQFPERTDPILRESELRIDGAFGGDGRFRVPYSLNGRRAENESGSALSQASGRLSPSVGPLRASSTLNWSEQSEADSTLTGATLLNTRFKDFSLRGGVDYDIDPEFDFTTASATANRRLGDNFSYTGSVVQQLSQNNATTFTSGFNWLAPVAALGANVAYNTDSGVSLGLSLSSSFGREPRTGSWRSSNRAIARSGAASVQTFLDHDGDGVFTEADEALAGVRFRQHRDVETNDQGVALLTGLSVNRPITVELDVGSLEDPYWDPAAAGYEIIARPGRATTLNFPVYTTGEVDGVVFVNRNGVIKEVANVVVELVDEDGDVVLSTRSAFDGFYLFERVRPGDYWVRISPEQIARLSLAPVEPVPVTVGFGDDAFVSGLTFHLAPDTGRPKVLLAEADTMQASPETSVSEPPEPFEFAPAPPATPTLTEAPSHPAAPARPSPPSTAEARTLMASISASSQIACGSMSTNNRGGQTTTEFHSRGLRMALSACSNSDTGVVSGQAQPDRLVLRR